MTPVSCTELGKIDYNYTYSGTFNPATNLVEREGYLEIFHRQRQYGERTDAVVSGSVGGRANTLSVGVD